MDEEKLNELIEELIRIPSYKSPEFIEWLEQEDLISLLIKNVSEENIILYLSTNISPLTYIYGLIIPLKAINPVDVNDLLKWQGSNYDWSICGGNIDNIWRLSSPLEDCESDTLKKGEELLFFREFEGRKIDNCYFELSPKLTHPYGLHFVPERQAFCRFDRHGDIEDVISMEHTKNYSFVLANKEFLNLHLAITESALVRLFESSRFDSINYNETYNFQAIRESSGKLYYKFNLQKGNSSLTHGFQIIKNDESKKSIFERYLNSGNVDKNKYESFIAMDLKTRQVSEYSCDPKKLGNYFEESNFPLEMTPAFFNPQVLSKYKSDPKKYSIKGHSISCRNVWCLDHYDINDQGQIIAYLIYLSYLPHKEQMYWKSYNENPKSGIPDAVFNTRFLAKFNNSYDPLCSLKQAIEKFSREKTKWWELKSLDLIKNIHYVHTDSEKEWSDEIHTLDKLIIEGFNQSYLKQKAENFDRILEKNWGSLKIVEECLLGMKIESEEVKAVLSPLRDLHNFRSKISGHVNGEEANKIKAELIRKHKTLKQQFRFLIGECDKSLRKLAELFSN